MIPWTDQKSYLFLKQRAYFLPVAVSVYFATAVSMLTSDSASLTSLSTFVVCSRDGDFRVDGVRLEEADLGANIIFSGEAGVRVLADEPISLCFLCVARNLFT